MKNNIYNLIKFNLTYILIILIILFLFISLVNYFFSGHPRYWEIIHGRDKSDLKEYKIRKEKIIKLKKKNIESNYMSVLDPDYKELNYSGKYVSGKCGSIENGYNELIYKTDKYGFRENEDFRYIYSDYVLLGDSFTQSICENKPNDLKTILLDKTEYSFVNLGMQGTDYPDQAKKLTYYLNETKFNGLIWLFYEGNDYEKKSFNTLKIKNYIKPHNDKIDYKLNISHEISFYFKFKVWLAEFMRGPVTLLKFFKTYDDLLDTKDYDSVHKELNIFLNEKKINQRLLIYIPSWQKISLYKLKKLKLYNIHPQIIQLNKLKNQVKNISTKYGFKFVDGDKYFFKNNKPLSVFHYNLNTHFNKEGNEILSDIILKNLQN